MSSFTALYVRARGVARALRFAAVPLICAAVVAFVNPQLVGRLIALAVGAATFALGVGVHAHEIVLGRVPARRAAEEPTTTAEWLLASR